MPARPSVCACRDNEKQLERQSLAERRALLFIQLPQGLLGYRKALPCVYACQVTVW